MALHNTEMRRLARVAWDRTDVVQLVNARAYTGRSVWRDTIEGWYTTVNFEPGGNFDTEVFGFSNASTKGINSERILAMKGLMTRLMTETNPSRIDFKPSPRISASVPRCRSSKT
jgi:hypothetical protein